MSLISIDGKKCKRDGICAESCPMGLIELKDKNAIPVPIEGADKWCLNCGHCVAVCPHEAISLATMKQEDFMPIRKDLLPGPEQIEQLMRSRRSIRIYKERAVEQEILTKLIDVARYAPTGHNSQLLRWLVLTDKDEIKRLTGIVIDWVRHLIKEQSPLAQRLPLDSVVSAWESGEDRICRNAPAIIITHAPKEYLSATTDCAIALTYFELAASAYGLGTCWVGPVHMAATLWPPLRKAFNLPEEDTYSAMMLGYPKYKYHQIPMRNEAKVEWR